MKAKVPWIALMKKCGSSLFVANAWKSSPIANAPATYRHSRVIIRRTSNEKLWNHLFISTIPPFFATSFPTPIISCSTYRSTVDSSRFKDCGLNEGFIILLKKACLTGSLRSQLSFHTEYYVSPAIDGRKPFWVNTFVYNSLFTVFVLCP